jgi:hypothetical protein
MDDELKIKMYSFTMDCRDPQELAKFIRHCSIGK